jgi:hypothetical protein
MDLALISPFFDHFSGIFTPKYFLWCIFLPYFRTWRVILVIKQYVPLTRFIFFIIILYKDVKFPEKYGGV